MKARLVIVEVDSILVDVGNNFITKMSEEISDCFDCIQSIRLHVCFHWHQLIALVFFCRMVGNPLRAIEHILQDQIKKCLLGDSFPFIYIDLSLYIKSLSLLLVPSLD